MLTNLSTLYGTDRNKFVESGDNLFISARAHCPEISRWLTTLADPRVPRTHKLMTRVVNCTANWPKRYVNHCYAPALLPRLLLRSLHWISFFFFFGDVVLIGTCFSSYKGKEWAHKMSLWSVRHRIWLNGKQRHSSSEKFKCLRHNTNMKVHKSDTLRPKTMKWQYTIPLNKTDISNCTSTFIHHADAKSAGSLFWKVIICEYTYFPIFTSKHINTQRENKGLKASRSSCQRMKEVTYCGSNTPGM